jgi:hypothetical protein
MGYPFLNGVLTIREWLYSCMDYNTYILKSELTQLALKMDQFNQFDNAGPFFTPPPLLPPPRADASDTLALPPLATYPSREALYEAIQSWSKLRGYAFTVAKSKRIQDGRQRCITRGIATLQLRAPRTERVRDTQSRGTGCFFQVVAVETPSLGWELRYRPESRFNTHNHPPSQSPAAHPSHRRLPVAAQNTAQTLISAGNN